jgi:hypothetical protein
MNTDVIIVLGIMLVVVIAISYFFHTKLQSQQTLITTLSKKCEDLENMFNPRADPEELNSVFNRRLPDNVCEDGLCDLKPMEEDDRVNEKDIDDLVNSEIELLATHQTKKRSRSNAFQM